ncbi:arginine/serine-rich protein PNISR [Drosophila pseudoobscura]|uniref:Arginine/serine-rich protein PNISR n=2 Tax=Drosophila pseudoobscura TaxID=7237 RepID=A0A6I8UQT9_DROPS|nr:arginine/serine-rich protein PNISR [Drosophila pseudoobscura]
MFPGGNANADLGYNKRNHNQFMAQLPPPPPSHFVPAATVANPLVATGLPLTIDWAQLAQQWIHMRDNTPAGIAMPMAPPPPIIGNVSGYQQQHMPTLPVRPPATTAKITRFEEHGEADMDMDDDNERGHGSETPPPAPSVTQSQWLGLSGTAPNAAVAAFSNTGKPPWSQWPNKTGNASSNRTAHIPSLLKLNVSNPNEPHQQLQAQNQNQQQPQQPPQAHSHQHELQPQPESSSSGNINSASSEIDANKRKMLPAWIREGLEKMEREKQRQMERQHSTVGDAEVLLQATSNVKQVSSKSLTTPVNPLNIANVASDSEDSNTGEEEAAHAKASVEPKVLVGKDILNKAGYRRSSSSSSGDNEQEVENEKESDNKSKSLEDAEKADGVTGATEAPGNGKNYEERLADLMLLVRRTLTEILLETTNEEIAAIAAETLKAHRAKASSAQVIRKSALSSITGNLGLAAYGDSSSESDEDEDDEEGARNAEAAKSADKSVQLSAEELKARIRRSKRAFERVIDDIEDRVAKQEQRDEQTLQRHRKQERERSDADKERRRTHSNPEAPGETTAKHPTAHDKLLQFNGKRPSRKERTTRFSDNKDGKNSTANYAQIVATAPVSSSSVLAKMKPVPNLATNLLQMPEAVACMLSAAEKALNKANKSSRKSKSKRHQSSASSSSSSTSSSSSNSDSDDSNSISSSSKTSSSRGKSSSSRRTTSSRRGQSDHAGGSSSSSRNKYERRDHERERERRPRRNRTHYIGGRRNSSSHQPHQRRPRESSHSGEEDAGSSSYRRSSRHSSHASSYDHGKHRHRSRSRSKSRSTHHSHSYSSSSASQQRKRH